MSFYNNVTVSTVCDSGSTQPKYREPVTLRADYDPQGLQISFLPNGETNPNLKLFETVIERTSPPLRVGRCGFLISNEVEAILMRIPVESEAAKFQIQLTKSLKGSDSSVFAERTDDSSARQYFQFYGYLSQQQNMMQDYVRTATYQKAILANLHDFADKVILDVGAGSGILSFFAIQAGARKVYAVEASSMAAFAEELAHSNGLKGKLIVLPGKIEEIEIPEKVDAVISEPMGYMLFNERMLETYLHAKKWLKPNGKMFPSKGDLHISPFTDDALFLEQCNKANFWQQNCFHGVDLSCLRNAALKEYFRQPIVDTFDVRICLAKSIKHTVDFTTSSEFDLHQIDIPLEFPMLETGTVHGLAFWFDVAFEGSQQTVWLSTSPTEPLTHWYQVRCLLETPILAKQGQILTGRVQLAANKRQSYDVLIELELEGVKTSNTLDLKNPFFRYCGQPPAPPPGQHTTAPSDNIWATTIEQNGGRLMNGMTVNGSLVDGMNTLVEMAGPQVMIPSQAVMNQMNSAAAFQPHPVQASASVTHYTTMPLNIGDYVAAGAQHQSVLLSNSNVNVLPTHNINWSH